MKKFEIEIGQMQKDHKDLHILVLGDIMIDRYMRGQATRISPEAPVPVD